MTADIITSTDPKGVVKDLADDIGKLDGVAAVTKQTPNTTGDLGLVRVVPEWAQSDPRTTDLVQRIRDRGPQLEQDLKIADITVTGQTAVAIDVSSRLSAALVPSASWSSGCADPARDRVPVGRGAHQGHPRLPAVDRSPPWVRSVPRSSGVGSPGP